MGINIFPVIDTGGSGGGGGFVETIPWLPIDAWARPGEFLTVQYDPQSGIPVAWLTQASGGASLLDSGASGYITAQSGAGLTSPSCSLYGFQNAFTVGNNKGWACEISMAIASLSNASNNFSLRLGFGDATGASNIPDGLYFFYNHNNNSGRWSAVARRNSVETKVDTSVIVLPETDPSFDADDKNLLRIYVSPDGTEATFTVANRFRGAEDTVTIGTNIPNDRPTGMLPFNMAKTSGSTNVIARLYSAFYAGQL